MADWARGTRFALDLVIEPFHVRLVRVGEYLDGHAKDAGQSA